MVTLCMFNNQLNVDPCEEGLNKMHTKLRMKDIWSDNSLGSNHNKVTMNFDLQNPLINVICT